MFNLYAVRRLFRFPLVKFAIVGASGFLLDSGIVYLLKTITNLYVAGLLSYLGAATFTWAVNRRWTFRCADRSIGARRQWALFLATNTIGFILNRGTYFALIAAYPLCDAHPILALAAGAIAGMFVNFTLSRRIVFR